MRTFSTSIAAFSALFFLGGCNFFSKKKSGDSGVRIWNGKPAPLYAPIASNSIVSIKIDNDGFCSGVLVSKTRILTARHCFGKRQPGSTDQFMIKADGNTEINTGAVAEIAVGKSVLTALSSEKRGMLKGSLRTHPTEDFATFDLISEVSAPFDGAPMERESEAAIGKGVAMEFFGFGPTQVNGNLPSNFTSGSMLVDGFFQKFDVPGGGSINNLLYFSSAIFHQGLLPGDSGGPVFSYNEKDKVYKLMGINSVTVNKPSGDGVLGSMVALVCVDATQAWILDTSSH